MRDSADLVDVTLHGSDDDDAPYVDALLTCLKLRLQETQGRLHGIGRDDHLWKEVLTRPELLSHDLHPRYQAVVDGDQRVSVLPQCLLGQLGRQVRFTLDQTSGSPDRDVV